MSGTVGVTIQCFCLNESIARPEFDPIYEELNRRKAIVFLHPSGNGLCAPLINDFGLTICAGASFEDAIAGMHLIARQIPLRYPDIRFIIPHFGGPLAMLLERLDGQMPKGGFAELPSITARRFYYDIVGWGSRGALLSAVESYGATQLVPGSDFPVLLQFETYAQTFDHVRQASLPASSIELILHRNAQSLLRIRD